MKRRAAIYARVSTEHEAQISALENQVQYYDELLARHPELELVERYIDEGITGTSINKRQGFLKMMQDAKDRKFDIIVTREVSRFARNTVDTLQQTRILKSYGVEVWFTEDNIWTLNDEDGELRLSIMATLAQNESKKISQRVKAGQMISFKNGVVYGNGNILGYNKIGNQMVVNKEQAEAVKRIFELYLEGNGVQKIKDIMEMEGYKTATGLTRWHSGNICKVLSNPFYCGRIEYRKQYVPDYLTQKKVKNYGEVEKVYAEGSHEAIITPEVFDKAQQIKKAHTYEKTDKYGRKIRQGLAPCKNVWGRKLRCTCGHAMNRRMAHKSKSGEPSYCFQCYYQMRTGMPSTRLKKGLSIDGICDNDMFMEWKLIVIVDFLFKKMVSNRKAIYDEAMEMLDDIRDIGDVTEKAKAVVERNTTQIAQLKKQMSIIEDMAIEGDISKEAYRKKREKLINQISKLEQKNSELEQQIKESEDDVQNQKRMESLASFINMKAFDPRAKVPEAVIDAFTEKIIFDKGTFSWYLNPKVGNSVLSVDTHDWRKGRQSTLNLVQKSQSFTGCYRQQVVFRNLLFGRLNTSG